MNRAASSSKHLHNPFNKRAMTMIQLKRIEKDVSFCTQHIPITSYSIYIYICMYVLYMLEYVGTPVPEYGVP